MATELKRRRFTVDEYHRMAEAGILGEDDRVELIDGEIVAMSPIGSRHAAVVSRAAETLARAAGGRAIVRPQCPILVDDWSEPQPDLALARPRHDYYGAEHPGPADVLLVVEVADTSLEYDRDTKAPRYAQAGIPELWIFDLHRWQVLAYQEPSRDGYRLTRVYRPGETLPLPPSIGAIVAVDELLGPEPESERSAR